MESFACDLCNFKTTEPTAIEAHYRSKEHIEVASKPHKKKVWRPRNGKLEQVEIMVDKDGNEIVEGGTFISGLPKVKSKKDKFWLFLPLSLTLNSEYGIEWKGRKRQGPRRGQKVRR
eukprot:TRINITY_DN11206_c0_g1_i3.p1 TRINITY_DN11206_c0_g1~~TRINITY_DN11206_c0_g1_i3.p1  ORF type:complete len:117 (-),score=17.36 TRINITY_DN11206_c0_g1_i3:655-1005(-)